MTNGEGVKPPGSRPFGPPRTAVESMARLLGERSRGRLWVLATRSPAGVAVVFGLAALGFIILFARPRAGPRLPAEYATLAGRLADRYQSGRDEPGPVPDVARVVAELRNAALDLKGLKPTDPDIDAVAGEARRDFEDAAASLERLAAMPKPPGVFELSAESFLRGFVFDLPGLARRYDELSGVQDALVAEARGLAAAVQRGEADKLMLPRIAARYGGPPPARGRVLLVDFDGSWGPVGLADWVTLTNSGGVDLHNGTVLVEVRGESGDVARSVHFVPAWRAGAAIDARYATGDDVAGLTIGRRTVKDVADVTVSLWADELSQEGVVHAYAGAERDADIARYCAAMRVRARYRPFRKGYVWNTERGAEVWLEGVPFVPNPRVTATFRRGPSTLSWYWDFARWDGGECKTLDAAGGLPWDPEEFTVEVAFPHTGFKYPGVVAREVARRS